MSCSHRGNPDWAAIPDLRDAVVNSAERLKDRARLLTGAAAESVIEEIIAARTTEHNAIGEPPPCWLVPSRRR